MAEAASAVKSIDVNLEDAFGDSDLKFGDGSR